MKKSIEWLKAHPILTFFILTLVLLWLPFIPALYLFQIGLTDQPLLQILVLYISRLVVYSPVLSGILVTRWTNPFRSSVSTRKRWFTFGIVWLAALIVSTLDLWRNNPDPTVGWVPVLIISIPIAILPAFVFSRAFSQVTSLRDYLSTLVRPKGQLIWYLVALLTFPVIQLLGVAITNHIAGRPALNSFLYPGNLSTTLISFASVFFYSGGVNEEGGWRGFAQRRLQANHSPLVTNLLLWAYLVIWHIPNDITQYSEGGYLLIRIGLYPFILILFGWVYNRTRGSILAPALFHASMNSMNTLQTSLPVTNAGSILLVLCAVFAVFYDRMWKKLPADHPAVYAVDNAA